MCIYVSVGINSDFHPHLPGLVKCVFIGLGGGRNLLTYTIAIQYTCHYIYYILCNILTVTDTILLRSTHYYTTTTRKVTRNGISATIWCADMRYRPFRLSKTNG